MTHNANGTKKQGLTAQDFVLPNEDASAFDERMADWMEAYRPGEPAQRVLIERAVQMTWRLERCAKAEAARLAERVRHASENAEKEAREHAEGLGRHLLFEPLDRTTHQYTVDPNLEDRYDRREVDHPSTYISALQATAQGVDWLLARWAALVESLDTFGSWQDPEIYTAARLLGRRPEDSTDDPVVARLILASHAVKIGPWNLLDAFTQARRGIPGRPVDWRRVERLAELHPTTSETGMAWLRALIERETSRLQALKDNGLIALAEIDRLGAVDRALFDDSPSAVLLRRYETACERELRRTIADASKFARRASPLRPATRGEGRGEGSSVQDSSPLVQNSLYSVHDTSNECKTPHPNPLPANGARGPEDASVEIKPERHGRKPRCGSETLVGPTSVGLSLETDRGSKENVRLKSDMPADDVIAVGRPPTSAADVT